MFCSHCGKEIPENSKFCPNCGGEVKGPSEKVDSEVVSGDAHPYVSDHNGNQKNGNGSYPNAYTFSLVGFILSFIIPVLGIIFSAIGLDQLSKSGKTRGKGFAIAGLVIGIILAVNFGVWCRHFNWHWNVNLVYLSNLLSLL